MCQKTGYAPAATVDQLPQIISLSVQAGRITREESWWCNTNNKLTYRVLLLYFWRDSLQNSNMENCIHFHYESTKYISWFFTHQVMFRKPVHNLYQHIWQTTKQHWQQACGENCNKRWRRCDNKTQLLMSYKSNCNIYQWDQSSKHRIRHCGSIYCSHWPST